MINTNILGVVDGILEVVQWVSHVICLSGHNGSVTSLGWSRDTKWIVTSCDDKTANIWSLGLPDPVLTISYVNNNFGIDKEGGLKPSKVSSNNLG